MTQRAQTRSIAFVLDMGPNGLGITRSLGREGIQVVGADSDPLASGLYSTYCKRLITSDPVKEPQRVLSLLLSEGKKHLGKSVLFPASDANVLLVSRFRRELSECFQFAIPSKEIVESVINKRVLYELAEKAGIPHPKTHYPASLQDVQEVKDDIRYPVYIKPYYSHLWQERYRSKGFVANSPSEMIAKYKELFDAGIGAMLQSIVTGPDSNIVDVCAYLSEKSEPLATFVARKLRQHPNKFGVGTCKVSMHDPALLETGLRFFREINYVGPGVIEFKKDNRDGKYKMLELNARFNHSNIQATYAGVNLPLIQYLHLTEQSEERPRDHKDGVIWLDAIPDFLAFCQLNRKGELPLSTWFRSTLEANCHSYFAWDDMKPFIMECIVNCMALPRYVLGMNLAGYPVC
jgi:D-aspartate ligase